MERKAKKQKQQRPYVVAEFVLSFNYHGRAWTVGCNSEEAAKRAFDKRVAKNIAENGSAGVVIAYARNRRRPIAWTDAVEDPKAAIQFWDPII